MFLSPQYNVIDDDHFSTVPSVHDEYLKYFDFNLWDSVVQSCFEDT